MTRSYLLEVTIENTDLSRAYLIAACLNMASLTGSKLCGAHLDFADLRFSNLSRADFSDANLFGASLDSADLRESRFHGAIFGQTTVGDVDLSQVEGLESVRHHDRTSVGLGTLALTAAGLESNRGNQGAIEAFFRGCGVHDRDIDYFRSLIGRPIEFYSVFISYSHADKMFARRLYEALQGRGIRCWLDEHQMLPGDNIYDVVDRGIRTFDKLLLCCSTHSLLSWWVDKELTTAFEKEQWLQREHGVKRELVIPLNLDNCLFSWDDGKAPRLRERHASDFTGWAADNSKFEYEMGRLVAALRTRQAQGGPTEA